ncbi:hypothetical protein GUITHDRAFT_115438 [Guillardia theta CCMP2712]|uniref:Laminin G domain-containing protein n=1 Tax=Guillardia theta (strain CCMP2712) TaxID=905079 RepID=L1IRM1_GUITC|nr:hypothetical protein GUITHDRAFT_115438 [Guillardia theta CCMP2712]EKX38475.1 hypothetical protein GUITHDRAFT_115438 [Guillardia theta CCMP2712]|eukprot:XP_005825455.1 hypothetical protein GUITHDRAFT_115438 [Guillardia theta CCMP2712]
MIRGKDTGDLEFKLNSSINYYSVVTNGYINDGLWHNYAFTNDQAVNRIYIDGVEQTVIDSSEAITADLVDGLVIGEFIGELKDLRIYNVALDIQPTVVESNATSTYQNSSYKFQKNFKVNDRLLQGGQRLSLRLVDGTKADLDELLLNFIVYDEEQETQEDTRDWDPEQITKIL